MSERETQLGFLHDRLLQAAGAVLAVAALGACTSGLDGGGGAADQPAAEASVPNPGQTYTSPATPQEGAQWDAAYNFITRFDNTDLTKPVSVPTSITLPTVHRAVLQAAELQVADDVVYDAQSDPTNPDVARRLSLIQEPDIKARTTKGLVRGTYADILYNLLNGTTDAVAAEQTLLSRLLADDPADQDKLQAGVAKYTALARKLTAEQADPSKWSDDHDALSNAWSNAYDDSNSYWGDLHDDASLAEGVIFNHSPASETQSQKAAADYQKLLHHCDGLAEPAASQCAADEAVSDADAGYEDLFAPWAKKVKDPAQKKRLETAAANAAISDINDGYDDLADAWLTYVHDAGDLERIDRAYVQEAKSDYQDGYSDLGDAVVAKIHNPSLRAEAQAYDK